METFGVFIVSNVLGNARISIQRQNKMIDYLFMVFNSR